MMDTVYHFAPIGVLHCAEQYKFEAPRQGVFTERRGIVELQPRFCGAALNDLEGVERIWLIFCFHRNLGQPWKALVRPPLVPEERKYGLFATRSPYRPNPIGISCVVLEKIAPPQLFVSGIDLLDGTPILDIKPYIPEADAFPGAAAGWRDQLKTAVPAMEWSLDFTPEFLEQAEFLRALGVPDPVNFCQVQLRFNPLDRARKRLYPGADGETELGCRTWRIVFRADETKREIKILRIRSHYPAAELADGMPDPYLDKSMHRSFLARFFPR